MNTIASPPALTPAAIAATYEACLRAVDESGAVPEAAMRFAAWLADHWQRASLPEPAAPPDAVSHDGRGIAVIRWYAIASGVAGWVPGERGHYFVPLAARVPRDEARSAAAHASSAPHLGRAR